MSRCDGFFEVAVSFLSDTKEKEEEEQTSYITMSILGDESPGSFASKKRGHECSSNCQHRFVRSKEEFNGVDKTTACATAHVLNALPEALKRFEGAGTKEAALTDAKAVTLQAVINPSIESSGLKFATARALGVKPTMIQYGINVRGDKSVAEMNQELQDGVYRERKERGDKYPRMLVYNYFHHDENLPDFSSLVEPNKNSQVKWKGKRWRLDGKEMKLTCEMKLRKGTVAELAEEYLNSETHRR